jgi:pyrroloquinoline quinone biosynthesis protein B
MRARILGSSAGGGLPQWNCACANCQAVRRGDSGIEPRTQDSVLVLNEAGDAAFLLNASPDVLQQLAHSPELQPRRLRHTPLTAVVLTSGDLDHCLGLLSLREDQPFSVYSTWEVQAQLRERNVMFRTLERSSAPVRWHVLELERTIELPGADGRPCGVELTPFALPGKPPRHLEGLGAPSAGDQIGLALRQGGRTLVYASSIAKLDGLEARLAEATALLLDGTFFHDDELLRLGVGERRAADMAHLPVGGDGGSLARIPRSTARRIYTHINNTNPMLAPSSAERAAVEAAGWEIAHDGMQVFA